MSLGLHRSPIPMADPKRTQRDGTPIPIPNPNQLLQQWNQFQLLDSILPTGGFAHSLGLESAIQSRIVNDQQDLFRFAIHVLENTASLLLPFVYTAARSPDIETLLNLDSTLDAMLTNEVSRKASITQGSALMRVAANVFSEFETLKEMRNVGGVGMGKAHFHHAVVFGIVMGVLGFDCGTVQRGYVYVTMRDLVSAATRLNVIGPQGAAVLLHRVGSVGEEVLGKWMDREVEDACQVSPVLDTVQGCHGYLFSRMFCS